jgi:hypothetical protein
MTTQESLKELSEFANDILSEIEISDPGNISNKSTSESPYHVHFNSKIHKLTMLMEPFARLVLNVN